MSKIINLLVCCIVLAVLGWASYWYVTVPQPGKIADQVRYFKDSTVFQIQVLANPLSSDPKQAIEQIRPLANEGNIAAELKLTEMFFKTEDYIPAIQFLRTNIDRGIPTALNAYGVMIRDGLGGVPMDKLEAYKWFSIAAGRGLKLAEANALALSHQMTTNEVIQAEHRADTWELNYYMDKK